MAFQVRDFVLGLSFAGIGLLFTTKQFVEYYYGLNPIVSLVLGYLVFYLLLWILSSMELVMFKFNVKSWNRFFGLFLITTAFYVVTTWSSCFYSLTLGQVCPVESPTIDGVLFWLSSSIVDVSNSTGLFTARILTYVVAPFIFALVGGMLLRGKPEVG